jgi:hypothetical protein
MGTKPVPFWFNTAYSICCLVIVMLFNKLEGNLFHSGLTHGDGVDLILLYKLVYIEPVSFGVNIGDCDDVV